MISFIFSIGAETVFVLGSNNIDTSPLGGIGSLFCIIILWSNLPINSSCFFNSFTFLLSSFNLLLSDT